MTTVLPTSGTLSYSELQEVWTQAGGSNAPVYAAIALAESSGRIGATHTNSNGTEDDGLWQINSVHGYDRQRLLSDPLYNAQAGVAIANSQGITAWSTYTSGAYKPFLGSASTTTETTANDFGSAPDVLKGTHIVSPNSKGAPKPFPGSGKGALYTDGKGKWVFRDGSSKTYNLWTWTGSGPWKQTVQDQGVNIPGLSGLSALYSVATKALSLLTSADFWKRVGIGLGALVLLVIGFIFFNEQSVSGTAKKVGKVAPLLAAA